MGVGGQGGKTDGAYRFGAAILDVEIDFLSPLLADVGAAHRRQLGEKAGEMAEEAELVPNRRKCPDVREEPA